MEHLSIIVIRTELWKLADELRNHPERHEEIASEVTRLANASFRRPAKKHARNKATRITPALRDQVRAFILANPTMLNRDIGRVFNIDGGRVSEIIHGLRG
jgi:hypothetical protein